MNIPLQENNCVIFRIWMPNGNSDFPNNNCGHVSIETVFPTKKYMGFWPVPSVLKKEKISEIDISNFFQPRYDQLARNLADDILMEGGPPNFIIVLYAIEPTFVINAFEKLRFKISNWQLVAPNTVMERLQSFMGVYTEKSFFAEARSDGAKSYSSIVYEILKEGGLCGVSLSQSSDVVNPIDLLLAVIAAKRFELESYPETNSFQYQDGTSPAVSGTEGTPDRDIENIEAAFRKLSF